MNEWSLVYEGFDPEHEALREALCTLGNGYFATRGAAEECQADDIHYPGTYLAGGYNRLESTIAGHTNSNEDLVNFPNWLPLNFRPVDGEWLNLRAVDILDYTQELDMRQGVLFRRFRVRDKHGHQTRVSIRRLVHMGDPHLAAIEYSITPENWSGSIHIRSVLDGSVVNSGIARYRELNSKHLQTLKAQQVFPDTVQLLVQTCQSHVQMAQAARTQVYRNHKRLNAKTRTYQEAELIGQELIFEVSENEPVIVEKAVVVFTSRDRAISECSYDARLAIEGCGRFRDLLVTHTHAWKNLWRRCDVEFKGQRREQITLRLHIFHLLQSVSPHSIGLDAGVPARGLHGEAYRGHIFWDELFIFPFYTFRLPQITRSLLLYRYRRLGTARSYASELGREGAVYPWQSGSNGREETPEMHLNPRSGAWGPDASRLQRHVNAAIVYNVWHYYMVTGDREFLTMYGVEMMLEIARFWASLTSFNEQTGRYEIHGVMGPDEYHEGYPGSDRPGLKNNAYTNVMAVWVLERAMEALDLLKQDRRVELTEQLGITEAHLDRWRDITRKMTVPFHGDGIISQFEGYDALEEFDWSGYLKKYGNIERLDRILKAEGDSPDRYKISKQADVLMLFYLLSPKELRGIFEQLGYPFTDETVARNVEYYLKRTSHGSTLSKVVHASVLDRLDRTAAWQLFREALESDITDVQEGTTPEGIHLGAMAGTVDIVMRHYAGIDTTDDRIAFYPRLPEPLRGLHLRLRHRDQWYELDITDSDCRLTVDEDGDRPITLNVLGETCQCPPGSSREFSLTPPAAATNV